MRRVALIVLAVALLAPPVAEASFPGQNGKIGFNAPSTSGAHDCIWTVNPDGSERVLLPPCDEYVGYGVANRAGPAWSSDGTRIAFSDASGDLSVMNGDGSSRTPYESVGGGLVAMSWSPDNLHLAYENISVEKGVGSFFRLYVTGAPPLASPAEGPAWSPDGTKIAFSDPSDGTVHTIRPDGTGLTILTSSSEIRVRRTFGWSALSWSPDGSKLALSASQPGSNDVEIYSMNADGTGITRLTDVAGSSGTPAWSPDGAEIAFVSDLPPGGIFTMNADGTGVTFVTHGGSPDWQPLPGPRRADYKNQAGFCHAEHDFWGDGQFRAKYGTNGNGANAFGKCVSWK